MEQLPPFHQSYLQPAEEALIAFRQLAEDNFGETEEVAPPTLRPVPPVSGKAFYYQPVLCTVQAKSTLTVEEEQERLRQAIDWETQGLILAHLFLPHSLWSVLGADHRCPIPPIWVDFWAHCREKNTWQGEIC